MTNLQPTSKQLVFARTLASRLNLTDKLEADLAKGASRQRVSKLIDRLIELDKVAAPVVKNVSILDLPEGHYAVEFEGVDRFIAIQHGDRNWLGWTFARVQASDEYHNLGRQQVGGEYKGKLAGALALIAADPTAAAQRYGQLIGRCGRCNRTLTDATSRAFGIGPECRNHLGIG